MNLIALGLGRIANVLVKTRFRSIVLNDAFAKLMIIFGAIKWFDLPHLHHPLIHLKIDLEYRQEMRDSSLKETK